MYELVICHADIHPFNIMRTAGILHEFTDSIGWLFDESLGDDAWSHALDEFQSLFGAGDELRGVVRSALDVPMPQSA